MEQERKKKEKGGERENQAKKKVSGKLKQKQDNAKGMMNKGKRCTGEEKKEKKR